jgi:colanic acid/amylovoran biosynthesis glycosyltransferase
MTTEYNLCIVKPNRDAYSETFIKNHIDRLAGNKKVLYGGAFPLFDHEGRYLIKSYFGLVWYLFQKRILRKTEIAIRDQALCSYLKQERIDVVLAEYGYVGASIAKACELAQVPLIIHFHGGDAHQYRTVAKYRDLYSRGFQYAKSIIGVSNDMLEALQKLGAPEEKLIHNPYGVDLNRFSPVDLRASKRSFLSVGRFVDKKSPVSVVRAFKEVLNDYPDAQLHMVGNGPLLVSTQQLVNELGVSKSVFFEGVLTSDDIRALMKEVRCFVQHSVTAPDGDMEGTPNTILEASAAGLPVVSTRHAGIKEAVVHGQTGFLVDEHDVQGMADYMKVLAQDVDLATELGANGTNHITVNYNLDKRIQRLDKVIQDSLS